MSTKENAYTIADLPETQEVAGAANTLRWQADRIENLEARLKRLSDDADALIDSHRQSKSNENAAFVDYRDLMALKGVVMEAKAALQLGDSDD